jgi:hypothetical protein
VSLPIRITLALLLLATGAGGGSAQTGICTGTSSRPLGGWMSVVSATSCAMPTLTPPSI